MTFSCGQYSSAFGGWMDLDGKPNVFARMRQIPCCSTSHQGTV